MKHIPKARMALGILLMLAVGCRERVDHQQKQQMQEQQQAELKKRLQEEEKQRILLEREDNSYRFPFRNRAREKRLEFARANLPKGAVIEYDSATLQTSESLDRHELSSEQQFVIQMLHTEEDLTFQLELIPRKCALVYRMNHKEDEIRFFVPRSSLLNAATIQMTFDAKTDLLECGRYGGNRFEPSLTLLKVMSQASELTIQVTEVWNDEQKVDFTSANFRMTFSPEQILALREFVGFVQSVREIDEKG